MAGGPANLPVVTGAGCVTPLGFGVAATFDALLEGRTGVRRVGDVDAGSGLDLAAGVEAPFLRREVPRTLEPQLKFLNGAGQMAVEVVEEAWHRAGWSADDVAAERKGLWLSQMDAWDWTVVDLHAGYEEATEGFTRPFESEALNREVARRSKPFFILESLKNNAFSFLANLHDLKGANTSVAGWGGASLTGLDFGARALRRGDMDRAVVVGTGRSAHAVARADCLRHGLRRAGSDPAFRPFDQDGLGEVRGEGAGALALERLGDARAAGRDVLGCVLGFGGATADPRDDLPVPRAAAYAEAADAALRDAQRASIGFVVVSAFGLPAADREILAGLAQVAALGGLPVVSWRGALGNTALGSELVDLVLALEALRRQRVPGTTGLETPIDGAECVAQAPFEPAGSAALLLAAGMHGGVTAILAGE